jgi:hypothetical protein
MERGLNLLGEPAANFAAEGWGKPSFGRFEFFCAVCCILDIKKQITLQLILNP